jgi:hypothetical protein
MSGRRDATGGRCHGGTWGTRSTAGVAARQVVATHGMAEVELVWLQDEIAVAAHGVVEPRDGATTRTARASATDRTEVEQ